MQHLLCDDVEGKHNVCGMGILFEYQNNSHIIL